MWCNILSFAFILSILQWQAHSFQLMRYQSNIIHAKASLSRSNYPKLQTNHLKLLRKGDVSLNQSSKDLVGEDAASFSLSEQNLKSWLIFSAAVATILSFLFYVWIYENGPLLGDQYLQVLEAVANGDSTAVIVLMLGFFAVCHSGLASLRPYAEEFVGPRVWRVVFALVSLPLAFSSIVYFINHRLVRLLLCVSVHVCLQNVITLPIQLCRQIIDNHIIHVYINSHSNWLDMMVCSCGTSVQPQECTTSCGGPLCRRSFSCTPPPSTF